MVENGSQELRWVSALAGIMVLAGCRIEYPRAPQVPDRHGTPGQESYAELRENPFRQVAKSPRSTFRIDVDTASYSNVRRFLQDRRLPPARAVRVEELINYFSYDHARPHGEEPIGIDTEVAACPWHADHQILMVGLSARTIPEEQMPPRNLVFLLDVSGSMDAPDKLPLLRRVMHKLTAKLRPVDRVAIVTYARDSSVVLEPTSGRDKGDIIHAIDNLATGGRTNGGAGIEKAYELARREFGAGSSNRVILATDGDFNVGVTSHEALVRLIEKERDGGVFLTVVGLGTDNLNDKAMVALANHGNGNYVYLDATPEARNGFQRELGTNLVTIAKDVKVQVEFNPANVCAYRLLGYENRVMRGRGFRDDAESRCEMGVGHTVTALYEIVPAGGRTPGFDPLRYRKNHRVRATSRSGAYDDELAYVNVRYEDPDKKVGQRRSVIVMTRRATRPSTDVRFACAVAAFGMILRDSQHKGTASYPLVQHLAGAALGADLAGDRKDFVRLVQLAEDLDQAATVQPTGSGK